MKSTEIYQMKRNLLTFLEKLTKGLSKPRKKFYSDILYGMSKAQNTLLSDIARALEEKIDLQYTIKRLSRNAAEENDLKQVHRNYLNTLKTSIPDNPLVIVDESEIVKPYAEKMEDLALVRDASKNVLEKGYPTLNFSMATPKTKHPLPLYNHLYSSKEEDFQSQNIEIAKGFNTVHTFLGKKKATFVMDRGYDRNMIYEYVEELGHHFITRLNDNRYLLHKNRRIKVPDLANRRKGKINFKTEIQGEKYHLKVSHIKVKLPVLQDTPLYMVVVYGYGAKPMKLLTNHSIKGKDDVLRILKSYITRWRIEELFRVQKEEFQLEKTRTMTLSSLRILYTILNCIIGHYSLAIEKNNYHTQIVLARARPSNKLKKIKFYLYRFIRGVSKILTFDTVGIRYFHRIEQRSNQLSLL
ncbi:MAG TPA: transposase [Massilibacterium sp.]|nr:transposase [Massilibacterium sp.]